MQLQSKDGIACDLCGSQHRKQFDYYSVEVREGRSQNGRVMPLDAVRRMPVRFEFDLCPSCFDSTAAHVIMCYRPVNVGMICELTQRVLSGNFIYYYVDITGVNVKIDSSNRANIVTDPRRLEFNASTEAYADLVNKISQRRKGISQWTTST